MDDYAAAPLSTNVSLAAVPDQAAFISAAYVAYHSAIFRYLRLRTDDDIAADLTHDVFCALVEASPRLRADDRPLLPWLYGVARHLLADATRRRAAYPQPLPLDAADVADDLGETHASCAFLVEALRQLPPGQQRVCVLRLVAGRCYAEIGDATCATEPACRMQFARGVKRLRASLAESLVAVALVMVSYGSFARMLSEAALTTF